MSPTSRPVHVSDLTDDGGADALVGIHRLPPRRCPGPLSRSGSRRLRALKCAPQTCVAAAVVIVLSIGGSVALAPPAAASYHEIKITEVFPGETSSPNAEFVELQMYGSGQNIEGSALRVFDDVGRLVGSLTFPHGVGHPSPTHVLVGTSQAAQMFGVEMDFVLPTPYWGLINGSGGKICYSRIDTHLDCVTWGNYSGPGPVGMPAPEIPSGRSLVRDTRGGSTPLLERSDDTDDSFVDFGIARPSPRNSEGNSGGPPDQTAPEIHINRPSPDLPHEVYLIGYTVIADYRCVDELGGSGVASCTGPVANGGPIDTTRSGNLGDLFEFTVTATDNAGNTASKTAYYRVIETVPPVVTDVVATPNPAPVSTPIALGASVSDTATGGSSIVSAAFTVDGGAPTAMAADDGAFDEPAEAVSAAVPATAFTSAGLHKICVIATDGGENTSTPVCDMVAVYDPSAGYVTGRGVLDSPPGAYVADPLLSGRAMFAFESRYQGATVPAGSTDFRFRAAGLDFRSTSYDWLIVSGRKAQYMGHGEINGKAGYRFLVTANDGAAEGRRGVDRLRLKIWDAGTGTVVYDNQRGDGDGADATDVVEGGSIAIRR